MTEPVPHPSGNSMDDPFVMKAGRAVRSVLAGRIVYQLLTIGFTLVLARILTPADYGIYGIAFVTMQLLIYVEGLRIESALVQRSDLTAVELSFGYTLLLGLGLLFSALMFVSAAPVASVFGEPDAAVVVRMLSAVFIIRAASSIHRIILRRELRFGMLAVVETVGLVPGGVIAVWLGVNGYGAVALAAFYLTQTTVASVVAIAVVGIRMPTQPPRQFTRDVLGFGVPATGGEVVSYLWFHAPSIVVGWGLGSVSLGFFRQAMALVSKPVVYLHEITNQLAFPVLSRAHEQGYAIKGAYLHAFHRVSLVAIPLCTFTVLLAPELVRLLYGPQWDAIVPLVRILVPVALAKVIHPFASGLFQARGKPATDLKIGALFLMLLFGLLVAGLQAGVTGIAVATSAGFGALAIGAQLVANRWLDISLPEVASTMLTGIGASLVAGGASLAVKMLLVPDDMFMLALVVAGFTGMVGYAGCLWVVDRTSLRELIRLGNPFYKSVGE